MPSVAHSEKAVDIQKYWLHPPLGGLEPGAAYHVYAVVTEGPYAGAKKVSGSVAAEATAKA